MEFGGRGKAYTKGEERTLINIDSPDFDDNLNFGS